MPHRLPALLLLTLSAVTTTVHSAPTETSPGNFLETRWGVGAAYGPQWYGDAGEAGTVGALQLTYRAYVENPEHGLWLFELGVEHASSLDQPEVADGEFKKLTSTGVFYRFNKFFGRRFYLGGRVGFARVRGTEEKENLDLVVGVQTGVRLAAWLDAGLEFVSSSPATADLPGKPGDVRGVVTVSF